MTDNQIPLAELRNKLAEVIGRIAGTQERFGITKHGRESTVVLMAIDDLRSLLETVDALTSFTAKAWVQLAQAEEDLRAGNVVTPEEAMADLKQRHPWLYK